MKKAAIIGAGVAGYTAAMELSKKFEVFLFEKDLPGGTCVNRGCIPVKYLVHRRELLNEIKKSSPLFNENHPISFNMQKVQQDKNEKTGKIRDSILAHLKKNKVKLIQGETHLEGKTVICGDTRIDADYIIVATGSKPLLKRMFEIEPNAPVSYSSDDFIHIEYIPETLAVIGGGYIGIELASIFSGFGSKVTVFERNDRILPGFETASSRSLEFRMKKNGMDFVKNATVRSLHADGKITYENANKELITTDSFSHILVSIGREVVLPEGLKVEQHTNGYIKVDSCFHTSLPGVYAIGDVIGQPFFAHRSARQAHLLSWHLSGEDISGQSDTLVPEVVFTEPELAKVGLDEDQLNTAGIEYHAYKIPYGVLGKSVIMDESGQLKVLTDKHGIIIGAVLIGKSAGELIGYMAVAIAKKMTLSELKHVTLPHPTLSELFLEIGLQFG